MNTNKNYGTIYLLQPFEFKEKKLPIFKVGKTKRTADNRLAEYSKNSKVILTRETKNIDNIEKHIIKNFNLEFKLSKGREYFIGNKKKMMEIINEVIDIEMDDDDDDMILDNKILSQYEKSKNNKQKLENNTNTSNIKEDNENNKQKLENNTNISNIKEDNENNKQKLENNTNTSNKKEDNENNKQKLENNTNTSNIKEDNENIDNTNNENGYKCDKCKKIFKNITHFQTHISSDTACEKNMNKNVKCEDCGNLFTTKKNMKQHQLTSCINKKVENKPSIKEILAKQQDEIIKMKEKINELEAKTKKKPGRPKKIKTEISTNTTDNQKINHQIIMIKYGI